MAAHHGGHGGDAATEVLIGCLDVMRPAATALVVGEGSGRLAAALAARGTTVNAWTLTASEGDCGTPQPWPEPQPADAAFLRLPKAKELLDLMLHAAASNLKAGAEVVVFGANDEGIRSADRHLGAIAANTTTIVTKRHCRVLSGQRLERICDLKGSLSAWRRVGRIDIAGEARDWVSYPGVFAKGGLDAGTKMLAESLGDLKPGLRVLDFAAGTGVLAAWVVAQCRPAQVDMVEADALAMEAARENVPDCHVIAGCSLKAVSGRLYDLILSNPPVHLGVTESRTVLDDLIRHAQRALAPGGELRLVVQRRIAVMEVLQAAFGNGRIVAEDGRFTVASAVMERAAKRGLKP